ncbi:MAG: class I SAM-dependent methyltransferase [Betaproteobacteria bacterium]|nr:MAG: class I SAM-dependent methyltransferase [Betaproteobacteria bacterium]
MTVPETPHQGLAPSPWVTRWIRLLQADSLVLDVACGFGRHTRLAVQQGHRVVAVDRNEEVLAGLESLPGVRTVQADIENGEWPVKGQRFDAVIVTNYLHRPLFPALLKSVTEAGLLIYETFAKGNERFGRPSNPDYLLEPGELCNVVRPSLRVLGYEDVYVDSPKPAMVQRVCACGPRFVWPENDG